MCNCGLVGVPCVHVCGYSGRGPHVPPGLSQRPLVLSPAVKGPLSFPQVLGFLSLAEPKASPILGLTE